MFEIIQSRRKSDMSRQNARFLLEAPFFPDSLQFYFYNISLSNCAQFCATMQAARPTRTYRWSGVHVQIFDSTYNWLTFHVRSLLDYDHRLSHLCQKYA
jgi:hypothetical protein